VDGIRDPGKVQGFWIEGPHDPPVVREEHAAVIAALERRFTVEFGPPMRDIAGPGSFRRFVIQPLPAVRR
jgi:hypothetical protein